MHTWTSMFWKLLKYDWYDMAMQFNKHTCGKAFIIKAINPKTQEKSVHTLWLIQQATDLELIYTYLRYLPHFIYVGFLLLKLGEGRLNFGNGLVIVGSAVWKAFGEIEAWNVYGGWRSGHHFGRWRAGRPRGWRGGCRCNRWRRRSRFLLWLNLLRHDERQLEWENLRDYFVS